MKVCKSLERITSLLVDQAMSIKQDFKKNNRIRLILMRFNIQNPYKKMLKYCKNLI